MAAPMKRFLHAQLGNMQSLLHIFKGKGYSFSRYVSTKQSIGGILGNCSSGEKILVKGWVKAVRAHRDIVFLHLSDGTSVKPLQVVSSPNLCDKDVTYGSCVAVEGEITASSHEGQSIELTAQSIKMLGACDPVKLPFKVRKKHPPEYVRSFPHLRSKTNTFSSLLRIRNAASMAVHQFFQKEEFCFVHTPILTSHDCEGAGEVFQLKNSEKADGGFFGHPTYLNVSGQLHLEAMASGLRKVYNFGPTFRAENSQGRHHLAEFNMIEAEVSFLEHLDELIEIMERMVRKTTQTVLETAADDIHFYTKNSGNVKIMEQAERLVEAKFKKITYTEAVSLLEQHKDKFRFSISWGDDLQKEHERWLTEHLGNCPVFVTDFPAKLKPFYARANADSNTVGAVDLLVPGVGELIGGSVREERLDVLQTRLQNLDILDEYQWYLDLRRFGSAPHGGFGLGFERYLQFLLGTSNIRDTIPFPRSPKNCKL